MKIGFDILGGDFAPKNCLEGLMMATKELPSDVKLVLIGDSKLAKDYFVKNNIDANQFEYVHTTEVIVLVVSLNHVHVSEV